MLAFEPRSLTWMACCGLRRYEGLTYEAAYSQIKAVRDVICPNPGLKTTRLSVAPVPVRPRMTTHLPTAGFVRQLKEFEEELAKDPMVEKS